LSSSIGVSRGAVPSAAMAQLPRYVVQE
jgi:hypothetical protein